MAAKSKEAKFQTVATSALKQMVESGPQSVTVSSLSRMSGVSRAWIYEYYGKTKPEILEATAKHWGQFFSRAGKAKVPETREEFKTRIIEGNDFVLKIGLENPVIIKAYFKFRGQQGLLADVVNQYYHETQKFYFRSFKKVMNFTDERADSAAHLLLITRMGCVHHILTQNDKTPAHNMAAQICNQELLASWFN